MIKRDKKLKMIFYILLCILLVSVFLILFKLFTSSTDKAENPQEGDLSRYQWIEMLCNQMGMTGYNSQTPYFKDVPEDDVYYSYIQSSVEWDVVEKASYFQGKEYATGRFIALTAMRTIGEDKLKNCLDIKGKITDEKYINYAVEYNLIRNEELNQSFSTERAQDVLNSLYELYFGSFWQDDFEQVEYAKDVIELPSNTILKINEEVSEIQITEEVLPQLEEGKIIVFKYGKTGFKIVRRITDVGVNGILQLDDNVKLDEILDSFVVSDISEVSVDDILNYYQLNEGSDALATKYDTEYSTIPTSFSSEIKNNGFKISLETEKEGDKKKLKIIITNNENGLSYTLPIEQEIENDSEYQTELDIDKILVATQMEYNVADGVKYAEIALDAHTIFEDSALASASQEKKILLCEIPTPLGSGIVGVKMQLYLVISAEGTLTLKAEIPVNLCARYEKGKGVRNINRENSVDNSELKANADASLVLRFEPVLVLFTTLNVLDVEGDIGASANAQLTARPNIMDCVDISVAFPVLKCSVGGDDDVDTIVSKLGISGEWEIISAENAKLKKDWHYEMYADGTTQFVEECTYKENMGASENQQPTESVGNVVLNHSYITRFHEVNAVEAPVFTFDYPDGWTVTSEEVSSSEEEVILSNETGATVTFWYYGLSRDLAGPTNTLRDITITQVADSQFIPDWVSGTNYSELGEFMVAEVEVTGEYFVPEGGTYSDANNGWIRYALLQKSEEGISLETVIVDLPTLSFWYAGHISLIANPFQKEFTEQEKQEVIAILSSFRNAD